MSALELVHNVTNTPREIAEARAERIRANVAELVAELVAAWRDRDDEALGFETFADYTAWLFGDVSRVSIPVEARLELVDGMTLAGHSVREIAEALGVGKSQIARDRRALTAPEPEPEPEVVDAEVVDAEVIDLDPFRGLSPRWETLARVAGAGVDGLTALELVDATTFALGTGPAALSKLDRAGFVEIGEYDERRRNRRPYRITERGRAKLDELLAACDR